MKKNLFAMSSFALVLFAAFPLCALASGAPFSITKTATYITEKSAKLNGAVNPNEMPDTYQWFEWGIAGKYETVYQTQRRSMWSSTVLQETSEEIQGLAPNTQYFYRQVGENGRGKEVGQTVFFTTKPLIVSVEPLVFVETSQIENLTESSAKLKGYISPHQGSNVEYWFEWGQRSSLENKTPKNRWGNNSGQAEVGISKLTSGTTYFYRIVAENPLGIVYGGIRTFTTKGLPPVLEEPKMQTINEPKNSPDQNTRIVTTEEKSPNNNTNNPSSFVNSNTNLLSVLFGSKQKQQSGVDSKTNVTTSTPPQKEINEPLSSEAQVAASGPLGSFWGTLTGKKGIEVTVEKVGPKKVEAHTPVEYRVGFAYRLREPAENARLKIILPATVVYIGDNTNNELLLEDGSGPERTYILPVGRVESGSTRIISVLGMTTGDAKGLFPDARVRFEYVNAQGVVEVVSGGGVASVNSKVVSGSSDASNTLLPTSVFGWLLYVLIIGLTIFLVRKGKAYYMRRKQEILIEEEALLRGTKDRPLGGQPPLVA